MVLAFIGYRRLLVTARRARSMVELQEQHRRWSDCVRTLENLLPAIVEVRDMEVLQSDRADVILAELNGKWWLYKAQRCMYLAHYYSESKKAAEAQALLARCREELDQAHTSFRGCAQEDPEVREDCELIDNLTSKLSSNQAVFRASRFIGDEQPLLKSPCTKEDLSKTRLIDIPPAFEPIPCKPVLFDLAGSELKSPTFSHLYEQDTGVGGFFSKLWKRNP
jgi:signal recognition particle subunit SRP68